MESPAGKFLKSFRWSLVARIVGVMVLALGIMLATTFEYETTYYLNGGTSTEYPVGQIVAGVVIGIIGLGILGLGQFLNKREQDAKQGNFGYGPAPGLAPPGRFPTGPRFPGAQHPPQQPGFGPGFAAHPAPPAPPVPPRGSSATHLNPYLRNDGGNPANGA